MNRLLPLLALSCLGCGANVVFEQDDGAGGDGGRGAGAPTAGGSDASGGAAPSCVRTHNRALIEILDADGVETSCELLDNETYVDSTWQGSVIEAGSDFVVFDTCPPNADCAPSEVRLLVQAPDLRFPSLQPGQFIEVSLVGDRLFSEEQCGLTVVIRNLESWGGASNPHPGPRFILAASEGIIYVSDATFSVEPLELECPVEEGPCGISTTYAFVFQADAGTGLRLPMGDSGEFTTAETTVVARNLRSYGGAECDKERNFAWWAVRAQP